MTDRPMTGEDMGKALDHARFIAGDWLATMTATGPEVERLARALLSTSAAVREAVELNGVLCDANETILRLREALEGIRYHSENQDISHLNFRIKARECADLVLSGIETEQEQARLDGLAPISTDTKGTTK